MCREPLSALFKADEVTVETGSQAAKRVKIQIKIEILQEQAKCRQIQSVNNLHFGWHDG